MTTRDITQTLREYAEAIDQDRGFKTGPTDTMRDAATVIDEQDREILRLQLLVDELEVARLRAVRGGRARAYPDPRGGYVVSFSCDTCPRCGRAQANVNNPAYLALLRPDQRPRHACLNCGWRAP